MKNKSLEELREWNKGRFWGGAGYDGSKDYDSNGRYTGEGERTFLQDKYNEANLLKKNNL